MQIVNEILSAQIEKHKTPGLQYLFFNQDSIIHSYFGGKANLENQINVTDRTTFNAYSVTKTFTALAILQMAEKGLLHLNDPACKYLPEFPYPDAITIMHLLSHSSGIPNPLPLNWTHLPEDASSYNRNEFFAEIFSKNSNTKSAPNQKFAYSNLGYILLGQIIEQLSGQSYEDYIRAYVLETINIPANQLGFSIPDTELHARGHQKRFRIINVILGFMMDKSKFKDKTHDKWTSIKNMYVNGTPYGGLIGNAKAFSVYLQELLKTDNRLISEDYKRMLFTENILENGKPTKMSLSWFKGELNGQSYYTHAGGGFYYCEIRLYPETGQGSVIMFNRAGMSDARFLDRIDKYFLEK